MSSTKDDSQQQGPQEQPQPASAPPAVGDPSRSSSQNRPSLAHTLAVLASVTAVLLALLATSRIPSRTLPSSSDKGTMSQQSRTVIKKIEAVETPEGDGVTVRRSIGTPELRNLPPFLMLDHFTISAVGSGFPDHPHRGQTTWTLLLDGHVQHEDCDGHAGVIGPGDLQVMRAGSGIVHAEMPKHFDDDGNRLPNPVGLQLWVDLPKEAKKAPSTYQDMKGEDLPVAQGDGWSVKVIAGRSHGKESPVRTPEHGGTWFLDVRIQPGGELFQELPANWTAFMYTLGPASLKVGGDGDDAVMPAFHTLVLSDGPASNGVLLKHGGGSGEARVVLFAAQKLDQEIYQYGPFVLADKADIRQAIVDYQLGQNGFERAPGFRSKIGGL
ncbi:unnamed protein product [Parajaminaea phylloscopi]